MRNIITGFLLIGLALTLPFSTGCGGRKPPEKTDGDTASMQAEAAPETTEHAPEEEEHGNAGGTEAVAGHTHEKAASHGGLVTMTQEFHFEVVFLSDSVRVYLYDPEQNPISARGVSGAVTLSFKDSDREPITERLVYSGPEQEEDEHAHGGENGHSQDFLLAKFDFSGVEEGKVKAKFELNDLPGTLEKEMILKENFKLASSAE